VGRRETIKRQKHYRRSKTFLGGKGAYEKRSRSVGFNLQGIEGKKGEEELKMSQKGGDILSHKTYRNSEVSFRKFWGGKNGGNQKEGRKLNRMFKI